MQAGLQHSCTRKRYQGIQLIETSLLIHHCINLWLGFKCGNNLFSASVQHTAQCLGTLHKMTAMRYTFEGIHDFRDDTVGQAVIGFWKADCITLSVVLMLMTGQLAFLPAPFSHSSCGALPY